MKRTTLFSAVQRGLYAVVASGLIVSSVPVMAQDNDDEENADLGRVQVTGSRISRADVEGALPVTVIDREQIELSGQTSVADLLRETSFNSGGSFRPRSGSSGQSFAGLSLRALGEGRTLILIDGKRAPIAPNIGSAQDLNSVPLAAVERIEILTDGASAIYGSDAIGGVVNIVTRKDFNGAELTFGNSFPEREGGDTRQGSAIIGMSGQQGQIMAGASFNSRDIVFARDREWSRGGASTFSNSFMSSDAAFLAHPEFGSANVPGCQGEGFTVTPAGPGRNCFYDFTLVSADEASVDNHSLFTRGRFDINRDWSLNLNAQVNRVESFGRYAPVPSVPWLVGGFGHPVLPVGSPNHPATPPSQGGLNPNWAAYQQYADETLLFRHRFAANGPRDTEIDSQVYDVDLSVQGRIGLTDVEAGVRRTESKYTELGYNYIVSALAQPQFDSGAYNIYDPFGNSQDVLQSFTSTILRSASYVAKEYYANANMDAFDLPAGTVAVAFGAEYRDEAYADIYDDLQANGNITGSAGNSASGSRDSSAVFFEALVPVLDTLEMTAALRYDDYSDFGDALSPKIAFRFQPLDELTLRASWGQGFRAPPLDILSARPSFSADFVADIPTCLNQGLDENCNVPGTDQPGVTQIQSFVIANPDLDAEDSDQFSIGIAWEPFDWLNGSIDLWSTEIDGRVAAISAQEVINCLDGTTTNCPPGLSMFDPGAQIPDADLGLGLARSPSSDAILFLQRGFASLGTVETSGFDLNLMTNFDFGSAGLLKNELQATYVDEYSVDSGDNVAGEAGLPRWRAKLTNQWSIGDFSVAWNINYIGSQSDSFTDPYVGLSSWTTHDLQANWYAPWNGRLTVGVDNLADKDPILDPADPTGRGFNFDLYDGYGRVPYVRYTQSF